MTSYSLDEQLRQVVLHLEPTWSAKEIDWHLNLDVVTISSDSELLTQVWINLIQNAIKFSPSGSTIEVSVSAHDQDCVVITDHGIGMDKATVERICDRFYQGDTSRSKEGVGLGLCLVKRILDMLGGEIGVTSVPGEGSSFCVKLPCRLTNEK